MTPAASDLLTRLARAVHLDAKQIDATVWRVTGGEGVHTVTSGVCDCLDAAMRARSGHACKHVLAVRLRTGDAGTLETLRLIVPLPARGLRSSRKALFVNQSGDASP